jgi:hypothetical protein
MLLFITVAGTLALIPVLDHYKPEGGYHGLQFTALSGYGLAVPHGSELENFLFGVKLDFLFLICYPVALFLLCRRAAVANADSRSFGRLGRLLSYVALSAIPSDLLDNFSVIRFLNGPEGRDLLAVGGICVLWNFAVVGVCVLYLIVALGRWLHVRRRELATNPI